MNEEEVRNMLINPYYAVTLNASLFEAGEPAIAKEDWVENNSKEIDRISATDWLNQLLKVLEDGSKDSVINPAEAIPLSGSLLGEHEALVSKEHWAQANEKLMKELGTEAWLYGLLDVLESGNRPS